MAASRTATCPTCSAVVADDDRFCKQCGTEVSGISASIFGDPRAYTATPAPEAAASSSPWEQVLTRLRDVTAGEFMIGRELGRGGMAAVFLGQDLALNRKVAIKVMAPGLMVGDDMVQRFRREAITIANLQHANIVTVHAVRQLQDLHFFVMQFVEGQSLDGVLRTHGLLPVSLVLPILHQVGSALAYAHRRGVVHRDIKPGNILLSGDGDALVTDFGIAKVAEGPTQTQTGMVVGTPTYMSPEQCYASELDGASDQYSLGIVAYQMLCGKAPFTGGQFEIMKGHTIDPVPSLREFAPDVPVEVEQAILRMLGKKPSDRFETFSDALEAMGAKPLGERSPLRAEMIQLAAVEERREALGDLLRTPSSPISGSRAGPRAPAMAPTPRTPSPAATAIALAVAPVPNTIEVGERVELRATVRGVADPSVLRWTTDAPTIVQVDERSGALLALSAGEASVVAAVGEVVERLAVRVVTPVVTALRIHLPTSDVHVGDVLVVSAQAFDRRGALLSGAIEWRVTGAAVSTDADGTLRATAAGRGELSAVCEGVTDTVVVHVQPARAATVTIVAPSETLEVGQSIALQAQMADVRGTPLIDRTVRWRLEETTRARIDAGGVVSALDAGSVVIHAQSDDALTQLTLHIAPARVARVELSGAPALLRDGDRFTLTAVPRDARGAPLVRTAVWSSSEKRVASVSTDGAVHALAAGATVIAVVIEGIEASTSLVVHATPPMFAPSTATSGPSGALIANATAVLAGLTPPAAASVPLQGSPAGDSAPTASRAPAEARTSAPSAAREPAKTPTGPARSRSPLLYAFALVPVAGIVWLLLRAKASDGPTANGSPASVASAPLPAPAQTPASLPSVADAVPSPSAGPGATEGAVAPETSVPSPLRLAAVPRNPLRVAETLQLRLTSPTSAAVSYSTSDRRIARVDARTGLVTALAPGRVMIVVDGGSAGRTTVSLVVQAADAAVAAPVTAATEGKPAATSGVQAPPSSNSATPVLPPVSTPTTSPSQTPTAAAAATVSQAQLGSEARAVVESFARAIESRDLGRVRAVFGGISSSYASDLTALFEASRSVRVAVRTLSVTSTSGAYDPAPGSRTSLSASVSFAVTPTRGSASPPSNDTWPIVLQRESSGWRLVQVSSP